MKWAEWQEFADNEDNWTNSTEPGLTNVEYLHDFVLRLQFADGVGKPMFDLDFAPLMVADNPGGVFADLKDVRRFRIADRWYERVVVHRAPELATCTCLLL